MMLVTLAWAPPSCSARLPQKFSAATTVTVPEPFAAVVGFVEQPASASARTAAPATQRDRTIGDILKTLTKTGSIIKCTRAHGTGRAPRLAAVGPARWAAQGVRAQGVRVTTVALPAGRFSDRALPFTVSAVWVGPAKVPSPFIALPPRVIPVVASSEGPLSR